MIKKIVFTVLILAIVGFTALISVADVAEPANTQEELTLPADTITVTSNEQIIKALTDAIAMRENFVIFDTSQMDMKNIYTDSILSNTIETRHPEYHYVTTIRRSYNKDMHFLSIKIYYKYYANNQDVFYVVERPGVYAVLDKAVVVAGETVRIDLRGENSSRYTLDVSSEDTILQVGEDNYIQTLQEGYTDIHVRIVDRVDPEIKYIHTFPIEILPEDVPQIDDIDGLITVAEENLYKSSQPIMIRNIDLTKTDMQNALSDLGMGYITCILNYETTEIYNSSNFRILNVDSVKKMESIQEKAEEIVSEIITPDMTELEKETALYDYLIQSVQYDDRIYDDPENCPFDSSTAYGPLFSNTGVCAGYAYALKALLTEAGIECITVVGISEEENHMWNIAKIDGVYYQLDPTFDSGMTHFNNELFHDYLNISDEKMKEDHTWDSHKYPPCTDIRFE